MTITTILTVWITTIIGSFGIEILNDLRMFKDVADAGYKINLRRILKLREQINPNGKNITFLSTLTPIVNITKGLYDTIQYNKVRPYVLDQLNVIDVLEEMSKKEKNKYLNNPTGLKALLITLEFEIKLKKAFCVRINNDKENSEIFYEIGSSIKDITILKVTGTASKFSVDEQKKKVLETMKEIAQEGVKKYGSEESFLKAIKENTKIDLSDNKNEEKLNEISDYVNKEQEIMEERIQEDEKELGNLTTSELDKIETDLSRIETLQEKLNQLQALETDSKKISCQEMNISKIREAVDESNKVKENNRPKRLK